MELSIALKQACLRQGWTMEEVAEKLQISVSYLYKIIEGKRCSKKRIKELEVLLNQEKELYELPYLSNRVKSFCHSSGISLSSFASSLNISLSYLYDVLNGRREGNKIKREIEKKINVAERSGATTAPSIETK